METNDLEKSPTHDGEAAEATALAGIPDATTNGAAPATSEPLPFLSKQQIMDADDVKTEIVDVPEWGGRVRVKVMTGPERDQWELACIKGRGKLRKFSFDNIRATTAAFCIVAEDGKRMFTKEEIDVLAKKSGAALSKVWEVASRINGLTSADVEELAGNSEDGPSEDS